MYAQLELSVHNFVTVQADNINQPKQNYWYDYWKTPWPFLTICAIDRYSVGLGFTFIGLIILALIIAFVPTHNPHPPYRHRPFMRGARLASLPFATAGVVVMYSAFRKFCSEVFSRGGTQLKPWELEDPAVAGVKFRKKKDTPTLEEMPRKPSKALRSIAPFEFLDAGRSASSLGHPDASDDGREPVVSINSRQSARLVENAALPTSTHEVAFVRPRHLSALEMYVSLTSAIATG